MIQRILRQPLFHFVVIGGAIFALFALVDDTPPESDKPQLVVSDQDAVWLVDQFQRTWSRVPTPDELDAMIEDFIREEVYVREALALGLDQGDTVVRRRLRQKMEFLSEAGAEAVPVDDNVLRAHYTEFAAEFEKAARIAFSQVLVPDGTSESLTIVLADLETGADPGQLGQRTLLPTTVPVSPLQAVDGTFGTGFFDQIAALPAGKWSGPVTSGYGVHIVRLEALDEAELPPFEDIRDRVELSWHAGKAEQLRTERFDLMREQYKVERPDANAVLSQ